MKKATPRKKLVDPSRHLGRKPTDQSQPLWTKPVHRTKAPKKKVRRPGSSNLSPKKFTALRKDGVVTVKASMLYSLEDARAIFAEEERCKVIPQRRGEKDHARTAPRPRSAPNLNALKSGHFRAPRKCVSGYNWVAWMSWAPYGWDDD